MVRKGQILRFATFAPAAGRVAGLHSLDFDELLHSPPKTLAPQWRTGSKDGATDYADFDGEINPLLASLIEELPASGEWSREERYLLELSSREIHHPVLRLPAIDQTSVALRDSSKVDSVLSGSSLG